MLKNLRFSSLGRNFYTNRLCSYIYENSLMAIKKNFKEHTTKIQE